MSKSLITTATDTTIDENHSITPEAYKRLRCQNRTSIANLSDSCYLRVLTHALKNKLPALADWVVLDILEVFQGGSTRQDQLLRVILSLDFSSLGHDIVLRILQHFQNIPDSLNFLTDISIERLARMASKDFNICDGDRAFLQIIHPLLHERIRNHHAPGGIESVNFQPPRIISAAFSIVRKMLALSLQQQALEIFHCLIKTRQIPAEAIQGVNTSSNDFNTLISRTLVRACIHWNWRSLATAFLTDILESTPTLNQSTIDLNLDVIYALLDTPTRRDLRACGHLIRRAHKYAPVPNSVVRQFYDGAFEKSATEEAEDLYCFTRSSPVLRKHYYPPPSGITLPWLMLHLTSASHRTHLSRVLASEVLNDNISIPLQDRAQFIAATAAQGYGTLSRDLWERYAVGKNKGVIVGDSYLMIRMVSLFASLAKRAASRQRQSAKNLTSVDDEIQDLTAFSHLILREFKIHHEPLASAPHRVLTSVARACFIVGKFTEGLECFSFLTQRRELPDLYDVNVALSAVAELKPRLAAKMIERMEGRDLRPDAVSFGTVMHYALLHRDKELVHEMIKRIRELGDTRLTLKSMAGLIRASVTPIGGESTAEQRSNLELILHLIKSFPQTNTAASSQIGKFLVFRSLEVQDPVLAYQFWLVCLKESAEWHDREQRFLRRLIAQMTEKYHQQLDNDYVASMLLQLGH